MVNAERDSRSIFKKWFLLLFAIVLTIESSVSLYAITIEGETGRYFIVKTPKKARIGEPFKAIVKAYDKEKHLIQDYNIVGSDVHISTTGTGVIRPNTIPASSFKHGRAFVKFIYNKSETFNFVVTPLERRSHKDAYVIGDGDLLEISVWEADGLTKDVIVAPDGSISFPLIGELMAGGKTLSEVAKEVTQKVSEYVREPQVSVMVKKIGGKRVIVFGEVKAPGVYTLQGEGTVMEVIAMAKGFTKDAVTGTVVIVRGDLATDPDVRMLNLVKAVKRGKLSREYIVEPNDIIYVPERLIPSAQYVIKQVLPGMITDMYSEVVVDEYALKDWFLRTKGGNTTNVTVD